MTGLPAKKAGWRAKLDLGFRRQGTRTILAHRRHEGPLVVQRPFYPEADTCHSYILHPPGGVVGGDHLSINIGVEENAHALVTTPAAGKFYRSAGLPAMQHQQLHIERDGLLEWLPQENILFSGSHTELKTHVTLASGSRFIGWELLCLGRPASRELFNQGACRQHFELWRHNEPLLIERMHINGADTLLNAPWGLGGYPVIGTMIAYPGNKDMLEQARSTDQYNNLFSASLIDDVLVCRVLGHQGEAARNTFIKVWHNIRPDLANKPACPPRIWYT